MSLANYEIEIANVRTHGTVDERDPHNRVIEFGNSDKTSRVPSPWGKVSHEDKDGPTNNVRIEVNLPGLSQTRFEQFASRTLRRTFGHWEPKLNTRTIEVPPGQNLTEEVVFGAKITVSHQTMEQEGLHRLPHYPHRMAGRWPRLRN